MQLSGTITFAPFGHITLKLGDLIFLEVVFVVESLDIRLLLVSNKTLKNTFGHLMSLMIYTLKRPEKKRTWEN